MTVAHSLRRSLLVGVFSLAALVFAAQSARAQVILFSADFNAPTYVDGPLNDNINPGQVGWLNTNAAGTNNISVTNSATDGFVTLTTSGQDVRHLLSMPITADSVFFRANITVSTAQATGDYALSLGDGGTSLFYARTYFRSSGAGFQMALGTSSGSGVTYGSTVLNFGQSYDLLVRYDFVAGAGNDTGALFIDPSTFDGTGDTPYVNATTIGTDATSINGMYLRQGSASNAAGLVVDDISVFINPVPEPTSMALAGVAVCGLAVRRFRKRVA